MKDKSKQLYDMITELYKHRRNKEVIEKCDKYLEITPETDNWRNIVKFLRAKSLRYLGFFDESIEELEKLTKDEDNIHYKLELFHVYYFVNRYEEALKLLPDIYNNTDKYVRNYSLLIAELVMRKQLGLTCVFKRGTRSDYVKQQVVEYDEKLALNHILNHRQDDVSFNDYCMFNDNLDLDYLMASVKKNLKTNKKLNVNDFLEIHIFSVYGVGYNETSECNYLKVIVCPNTQNIISMYPIVNGDIKDVDILHCDYDKLFKRCKKEKTISRVDRFNEKYNIGKK